jgi:hypothetical protein
MLHHLIEEVGLVGERTPDHGVASLRFTRRPVGGG